MCVSGVTVLSTFSAFPYCEHFMALLGCAHRQSSRGHWIPNLQATASGPALRALPAGLAWAKTQFSRVHLDPNLQSVAGFFVLKVQAGQAPQNFGICRKDVRKVKFEWMLASTKHIRAAFRFLLFWFAIYVFTSRKPLRMSSKAWRSAHAASLEEELLRAA